MAIHDILNTSLNEIREGLPWEEYRSLTAMNPSTLVAGQKSMRHLRYAWDHPREDTDALIWGRAVHCLLFEPEEFVSRYTEWNGGRRGGAVYENFLEDAADRGVEVLTAGQVVSAAAAAKSVVSDPKVIPLIKSGKAEVSLLTVEQEMQCKGRIDWIRSDGVIVDLKSTKNIHSRAFGRDFFAYHYDVKLGLYRRWAQRLLGRSCPVVVICVENTAPYDVTVLPIPDAVLDAGEAKGVAILTKLRVSLDTDHWPGIADDEEYYLEVPHREMVDDSTLTGAEVYVE